MSWLWNIIWNADKKRIELSPLLTRFCSIVVSFEWICQQIQLHQNSSHKCKLFEWFAFLFSAYKTQFELRVVVVVFVIPGRKCRQILTTHTEYITILYPFPSSSPYNSFMFSWYFFFCAIISIFFCHFQSPAFVALQSYGVSLLHTNTYWFITSRTNLIRFRAVHLDGLSAYICLSIVS